MKKTILTLAIAITSIALYAQVKISTSGGNPDASAGLEVDFNNKGFLPPRMTTAERNAITSPAKGLMIFNADLDCIQYNKGTSANPNWICSDGTNESNPTFICGTSTITDIDNNTYNTVLIGTQCWMKENLRVTKKPNGQTITSYCYNNNNLLCIEGRLYQWGIAMNGSGSSNNSPSGVQGICPNGWHFPSQAEYLTMTSSFGTGSGKSTLYQDPSWGSGSNTSGFSGMPAGIRFNNGTFDYRGFYASIWTATEQSNDAFRFDINSNSTSANIVVENKDFWFSVRCIKD
jgi:uncharacterized protein (TIGR02145 family)